MQKHRLPEILKNGFIIGAKNFSNICGILVYKSSSVAIKKGKRDGIIAFAQIFKPDFAACTLLEENIIKHIVNSRNIIDKKFFLILKTIIVNLFI